VVLADGILLRLSFFSYTFLISIGQQFRAGRAMISMLALMPTRCLPRHDLCWKEK
jgi:hypothetical protein